MLGTSINITWKTVSIATEKESKLEAGVPKSKLNVPPKSCIPNSAKIRMKRKSSNSKETIDLSDANRDTTRFLNDDQYLQNNFLPFSFEILFYTLTL